MSDNPVEKRRYIRHPSDIPIEISSDKSLPEEEKVLSNISFGGLCFKSNVPFKYGDIVTIKIVHVRPPFEAKGKVMWCALDDSYFDVGVEFAGEGDAFRARMVEQICRIEQYKEEVLKKRAGS